MLRKLEPKESKWGFRYDLLNSHSTLTELFISGMIDPNLHIEIHNESQKLVNADAEWLKTILDTYYPNQFDGSITPLFFIGPKRDPRTDEYISPGETTSQFLCVVSHTSQESLYLISNIKVELYGCYQVNPEKV